MANRSSAAQAAERTVRRLLTWQGTQPPSLESVRLLADDRLRAKGRLAVGGDGPYHAGFELLVDDTGVVSRLLISATTLDEDTQLSLQRSDDGYWYVDNGTGAVRTAFDGALDVDVAGTVLFNTVPVRRIGLHREPGTAEFPVVYVDLPTLRTRVVRQTYRTVSTDEHGAVINFSAEGFTADIGFDDQGVVTGYPGLAVRV